MAVLFSHRSYKVTLAWDKSTCHTLKGNLAKYRAPEGKLWCAQYETVPVMPMRNWTHIYWRVSDSVVFRTGKTGRSCRQLNNCRAASLFVLSDVKYIRSIRICVFYWFYRRLFLYCFCCCSSRHWHLLHLHSSHFLDDEKRLSDSMFFFC